MNTEKKQCFYVEDEPGDGTHYEFLIMDIGDYFFITKGNSGAKFSSYSYRKDSIVNLKIDYPIMMTDLDEANYQSHLLDRGVTNSGFIGYMTKHSECNFWTAICAARIALKILAEDWK